MFDIFEKVKNFKSIVISAHARPDGDAIGSSQAVCLYLKKRMPQADIKVYLEKPDPCFSVMPYITDIVSEYDINRKVDCFIMLDTVKERLGDAENIFDNAGYRINIDHHVSNKGGICNDEYIVPEISATSELAYHVMNPEYIDADIAAYLYMGIAHDTGVFRFSNTKSDTLRVVADLIEYSFDFSHIIDVTFYEKTYKQNKVQGQVVLDSKLYLDGQLIIGIADTDLMTAYDATKDDFDGVVNQLLLTQGVESAAFIYRKSEGLYKVSLRACSDKYNVSEIAMTQGGGGHVRASGFDYNGDIDSLVQILLNEYKKQF